MKFELGKLIGIASFVAPLVKQVQASFKNAKGVEKHEVVVAATKQLLPILEVGLDKDLLHNPTFFAALDQLIKAEKALLTAKVEADAARANVEAFVATLKRKT